MEPRSKDSLARRCVGVDGAAAGKPRGGQRERECEQQAAW
jgi:hypothetical protein